MMCSFHLGVILKNHGRGISKDEVNNLFFIFCTIFFRFWTTVVYRGYKYSCFYQSKICWKINEELLFFPITKKKLDYTARVWWNISIFFSAPTRFCYEFRFLLGLWWMNKSTQTHIGTSMFFKTDKMLLSFVKYK